MRGESGNTHIRSRDGASRIPKLKRYGIRRPVPFHARSGKKKSREKWLAEKIRKDVSAINWV